MDANCPFPETHRELLIQFGPQWEAQKVLQKLDLKKSQMNTAFGLSKATVYLVSGPLCILYNVFPAEVLVIPGQILVRKKIHQFCFIK